MKRFYGIGMLLGAVFAIGLFSLIEVVSAGYYTSQDVNYPIYIDNVVFTPNTPAQNVNGSTYLPLRAMSQALGVQIEWDQAARRVDVWKNKSPETKNLPDDVLWDYLKKKTQDSFTSSQSTASYVTLKEDNDEYAVSFMYYEGKNAGSAGTVLNAKFDVNFTTGTFELMKMDGTEVHNYKGKFNDAFEASSITKDKGTDSECKDFVKEKLDEYRSFFLADQWNLKLVGLKVSDAKNVKLADYIK